MAYIPPVNIPSLSDRDYGAQLFGMLSNTGQAFYQNRRDDVGDQQWQQEQERLSAAQALAQSNADRNYALELQKFEADQADPGGGDEYYGTAQWYEMDDGSMGFGVLSKGGDFKEVTSPEGSKWAPRVTYQDTGTARVPTFTQGGSVAGSPLPVHGSPEPGTYQTSPGGVPGSPGTGVPGLPGGGVPTYSPAGPKATREETQFTRERTEAQTKARTRLNAIEQDAQAVDAMLNEAEQLIQGGWATGALGEVMEVPGVLFPTERGELANVRQSIQANIGFDKLQSMREMSPTGGALGQVSDFENRLLIAVRGPMDLKNPEQMQATLQTIRDRYEEAAVAHRIAYMTDFEGLPRDVAEQAIDAIRQGKDPQAVMQRIQEMGGQ